MTNKYTTLPSSFKYHDGKVSVFTHLKGSITVEASMAVPFFFFAVLCLIYMFEVTVVQISVRNGLQYAGKMAAQESYPFPIVNPSSIEKDIVSAIGAERLERSIVMGGSTGIDCSSSYMSARTGIGILTARYQIKIPVPGFFIEGIRQEESIRIKAWTGYEKEVLDFSEDETVFVTETGMVYHKDYHCTYLDLSIQMVSKESLEGLRNTDGGKYYACWICGKKNSGNVYITSSGDKYHGSLACSGLKRTVYAVPLSEVIGKGGCIRCAR